jgi:TRAP-type C4-dicarboxylate transport system permease large subunit
MFVETLAAMIILVPFFYPSIVALGIHPVHFGLVVTVNLMIGILTPPFGTGLFVLQEVGKMTFEDAVRACLPFIPPLLLVLLLITLFPEIVLYVPRLIGW